MFFLQVDHFSKYGLSDSDEDDSNGPTINDPKRLKLSSAAQQKSATKLEQSKASVQFSDRSMIVLLNFSFLSLRLSAQILTTILFPSFYVE